MKGVKNFHDGVDSFGFVGMLLAFAQLTSRTKMILFKLQSGHTSNKILASKLIYGAEV